VSILSTQTIMLVDLRFDDNKAWQGGAFLLDSCFAAVIYLSTFTNNVATQGGGAVASVNNLHLGGLFIGDTSATGNLALTGGAVYGADQASITIGNGTVFAGNWASANGGALACVECASLTVQDQVAMQTNYAFAAGGALSADSSSAIQLTATTYFGNGYKHFLSDMYLVPMQSRTEVVLKLHDVIWK
jgi:predicted outer membrane repeat protein